MRSTGKLYRLLFAAMASAALCFNAHAEELRNPPHEVRSENGVCDIVLEAVVRKQDFPVAGPHLQLQSPVYVLRKKNGKEVDLDDKANCLVGPTLRVKRGDLLRICLKNRLDRKQLPAEIDNPPENYPQGFYITNLHTHGLHVSPSGRSDNIFVTIRPNEEHQYEYRIPDNHPPGTYWYHPHRHGSVAFQITGGMAGALIVEGDHHALSKNGKHPEDRIFVLQQIHGTMAGNVISLLPGDVYDKIKNANAANAGATVSQRTWRQELMKRKKLRAANANPQNPPAAPVDVEYPLVNGQDLNNRTISMQPGEVQRWRFIHAGIDEVIKPVVYLTAKDRQPRPVAFYEFSVDGNPRGRTVARYDGELLYPAYRVDVLFKAPDVQPGEKLELFSGDVEAGLTLNGSPIDKQLIATIQVRPGNGNVATEMPEDAALAQTVPIEFRGGVPDGEVDNRRWDLLFDFPENQPSRFMINAHEYSMDRIDRHVRLETAEEWRLKSNSGSKNNAGHPFHVHVNPFAHYYYEVARALQVQVPGKSVGPTTLLTELGFKLNDTVTFSGQIGPQGKQAPFKSMTTVTDSSTLSKVVSDLSNELNKTVKDSYRIDFVNNTVVLRRLLSSLDDLTIDQTCPLANPPILCFAQPARQVVDVIWRDTLMAPSTGPAEVVRMRFRDFAGDMVLHCHIVDHEDQGMMKNIRILPALEPGPGVVEKRKVVRAGAAAVPAPDFQLTDGAGKSRSLAELGPRPTVLIFFRGQACVECNKQLQAFASVRKKFDERGVNLVAVSSTNSEGLPDYGSISPADQPFSLLLSDAKCVAFKRFGCLDDSESPLHGTFVIDDQSLIRWSDVGMEPYMDVERVLAEIDRLKR